ncbi:glycoside hydrolase [Runella salmonicolor]|uniref:Glycoside hydrolase n=1 Tax=Runella salmonicolor TaxID=2950278 RepID=A0ABT1FLH1_9BACT|nr:glycoside hydrolase [Runella salmonicolor]MCP1382340.1 glycoside hydrolase [Runella salmonicolor]
MKQLFLLLILGFHVSIAQKLNIDPSVTYQTMHSFGASDCWSMQMVGRYYPIEKRNKIAELLFSKEFDTAGNPKGIGLSMWRFNIGAGSTEQGTGSKIANEWRRAECFLENGKYDWTKQQGQQWFLEAAKRHGVDFTLGFLNSAPVSMTKNGLSIGSGTLGEWNFDKSKMNDFADFLAQVSARFNFDYLSPFNEPQWDWGPKSKSGFGSQEGTPINNENIAWATRKIDETFGQKKLKTRIVLTEAAQIDYLYKSKTNRSEVHQDNQIEAFFDKSSPNYVGNLKSVESLMCGHSYFTTSPTAELIKKRQDLGEKIMQQNIPYWQSEYCILGDNAGEIKGNGVDLGMKTALYVAKVIHADLTHAHASAWHWWLSVSANDFKDGLIYVFNNGAKGENDKNKFDGEVMDSKLLWALGNYSRFIRPNMKRIKVDMAAENVLVSGYSSKNQVVVVFVNNSGSQRVELPKMRRKQKIDAYVTSQTENLTHRKVNKNILELPAESVVTLVITY